MPDAMRHETCIRAPLRIVLGGGILLFLGFTLSFSRGTSEAAAPMPDLVARGKYVFGAAGGCGCHAEPKGPLNAGGRRYDGPYITPDKDTGLGWSEEEIANFLGSGNKPDGDMAGGLMGEVIQGTSAGYKDLSKADRLAIARYLKTISPIRHKIGN